MSLRSLSADEQDVFYITRWFNTVLTTAL